MIALKNVYFLDSKPYISSLENASFMKFGDQWKDIIIFYFGQIIAFSLKKNPFLGHFLTF